MLESLEPRGAIKMLGADVGWLSASIAHDLRNPLGTICASAEMLMDMDATPGQVKRLAVNIYRAADRMRELVQDLSSAAKGNVSSAERCDIREVIAAASEVIEHEKVQVFLDAPEAIVIPLMRSQMERVFVNLIGNSVEAMPAGGTILIRARKTGNCALVEVEDTGPGISRQIRDRLFEPFVTAGKENGLGLGLAICRRSVREHGGDIWIEPAAGARFVMRLPLGSETMLARRAS